MFGPLLLIRKFTNFLKLFDHLRNVLLTDISDDIPCLFVFLRNLTLVLKSRAVTNPFPDLSNFPFDSEDVVSILFRLSNFDDISKVAILSLPLISLCFLTLRRPKCFMFTDRKQIFLTCEFFLPERLPSGATIINRRWCYNY